MLNLYNTLSRKIEPFEPLASPVGMYTCGPTVYYFAHIGNLRTYFFEDILKRVLYYNGYKVNHVMNVTDVGHLTSDADTGEDKIEKAAKETHKSAWEIAEYYTQVFFQDLENLNIIKPDIIAKATDHISEDIELIKVLEEKGYTYKTSDGIYFDTSKFKNYGQLTGMNFEKLSKNLKSGARIELSPEKKNITDFSLWKFSPPDAERQMEWDSPWGKGFPGWHIECSAINLKYLADAFKDNKFYPQSAKTIDIHTGGMDHIPIHHTNEIAQVEAATGRQFVKYWLHGTFLVLKKGRMGKSEGNSINLSDLIEKGFESMAYRYFLLNAQYRTALEFDFEGLEAAKNSLASLRNSVSNIKKANTFGSSDLSSYSEQFLSAINDDLNTPTALAVLWKLIKDFNKNPESFNSQEVYDLILNFDKIFGLKLNEIIDEPIPEEISKLAQEREEMRKNKKYDEADKIRQKIESMGYKIEDAESGIKVKRQ